MTTAVFAAWVFEVFEFEALLLLWLLCMGPFPFDASIVERLPWLYNPVYGQTSVNHWLTLVWISISFGASSPSSRSPRRARFAGLRGASA